MPNFIRQCLTVFVMSIVGALAAASPSAASPTYFTIILPQKAGGGTALFGTVRHQNIRDD